MTILRRSPFLSRLLHRHSSSSSPAVTVAIRREDPQRIWERRCPLSPDAVHQLVSDGIEVLIQDCNRRVWPTAEFVKAGARVHPTLQSAHITLGIKETPLPDLLSDPVPGSHTPRTHFMFSHTTKGQPYNMELLSKFVASSSATGGADTATPKLLPTLVDYEMLTAEDGKRTVGFGWFAGVAGTLESLCALAHAYLELGVASPFLYTPRPHTLPSLESIRAVLRDVVGTRIASEGTPRTLGPIVIGVTGTGKVAEGVLDILRDLPIQTVNVTDLPALVSNPDTDLHKLYVVHALPKDYFVRRDGRSYERSDYYAHSTEYQSEFHSRVAPYLSLLLNGAGWQPAFPRLMTTEQLSLALAHAQHVGLGRFACVGDISCDVHGGLEFLPRASTLSAPHFAVRPHAHLPPLTLMAVDILPTALPAEASRHFSDALLPYLRTYISDLRQGAGPQTSADAMERGRRDALARATVASGGTLREPFAWLASPLGAWYADGAASTGPDVGAQSKAPPHTRPAPARKVLMLGSGMVAGPAVQELCRRMDVQLLIASNSLQEAERLAVPYPNATAVLVDVGDAAAVGRLVADSDVVISLLPVPFHPAVAEMCIEHRKHLVTASYISPGMRALHDRAVTADVLLLNEIGLDPGIDHCSALSLLDSLRAQNKEILSFTSFCGGLPASEHADVPLGYKFSWSPRGVLTAVSNAARFKLRGRVFEIEGDDLLQEFVPNVPVLDVLKFEGVANRDSLPYAGVYGLEQTRTMFRGTLRYPGFCELMGMFKAIGLLEPSTPIMLEDWPALVRYALAQRLGVPVARDARSVLAALSEAVPAQSHEALLDALEWLSLVTPAAGGPAASPPPPPPPGRPMAPLDLFALLLAHKLRYAPHERDLVVLAHEIVARPAAGGEEEVHTSSLVAYGGPEASAMARCVGLPVAFAALLVLDGRLGARGVQGPTAREVYQEVLARLEGAGLGMKEGVSGGRSTGVEAALERHWLAAS